MQNVYFATGLHELITGAIDWDDNATTTIVCVLARYTWVPTPGMLWLSEIGAEELSHASYARKNIVGRSWVLNMVGFRTEAQGGGAAWPALAPGAGVPRWAVIAKSTGVDATSRMIVAGDIGQTTLTSENRVLRIDPAGLLSFRGVN